MTETTSNTSKYAVPEGETEEEHKVCKRRGRKRGGVIIEGEKRVGGRAADAQVEERERERERERRYI